MGPVFRQYAPPKLNLALTVYGRRPDGYHELTSLVAFATHHGDWLEIDTTGPCGVHVTGPHAGSITGDNILMLTLGLLKSRHSDLKLGTVRLEKNIPVASGVGGGSSDAAALLRAAAALNPGVITEAELQDLAAHLGSDVPVCLTGRACIMTGTGTHVRPIREFPQLACVLATPQAAVPADKTAQVFKALGAPRLPPAFVNNFATWPVSYATADEVIDVIQNRRNDLLVAAESLFPTIIEARQALSATPEALFIGLSGAGPTCFALYPNLQRATDAASNLAHDHPSWWIRATTLI